MKLGSRRFFGDGVNRIFVLLQKKTGVVNIGSIFSYAVMLMLLV
jgi:hypothetical protein